MTGRQRSWGKGARGLSNMGAARTSSTDSFLERIKYSATKLARKAKKMNKNVVLTTSGGVPAISAMPLASACEAQRVTRTT
jgi:hypothetical protein